MFFVDELVEGLDLGAFERRYEVMGEHPTHASAFSLALGKIAKVGG